MEIPRQVCGDICDVDFNDVPDADLMIGGFPCQGFSLANMDRKAEDPRNVLYLQYLRALRSKNPKYFLAENVRGILSLDKGKVFSKIILDFEQCGYVVQHLLVNAVEYGVPQNRYRVFIFGTRNDLDYIPKFKLLPTHGKGKLPLMTIGEALEGIPEPEDNHSLKNHVYSKFKLKNNGYINHRHIDANKPAPTVTARGDNKGGAMINHHPGNHRRLTVRETATIQSFPLDFEFKGTMTISYLQVGNAVPPLLSSIIGEFLNHIGSKKSNLQQINEQFELF